MRYLLPLILLIAAYSAYGAENSLQTTLTRMDSAAAGFKGLKADVTQTSHVKVINDNTVENGKIAVLRPNRKELKVLMHIQPPNEKKVSLSRNKVEIYYPKMNTVEEYDIGKFGALRDQLMMLAFGSTSKELQSAYTVTLGSPETIEGQKTTRLDLVPKDKDLLSKFPKIQLWISDDTGLAVQQTIYQPAGDYTRATYTNVRLGNVSEADVKLEVPKNAVRGVKPLSR